MNDRKAKASSALDAFLASANIHLSAHAHLVKLYIFTQICSRRVVRFPLAGQLAVAFIDTEEQRTSITNNYMFNLHASSSAQKLQPKENLMSKTEHRKP